MFFKTLRSLVLTWASIVGTPRSFADRPAVSIIEARKLALAKVPGMIVHEKRKDGKRKSTVWSIKIRPRAEPATSDHLVKVEIDARTGEVLKVKDVKQRKSD